MDDFTAPEVFVHWHFSQPHIENSQLAAGSEATALILPSTHAVFTLTNELADAGRAIVVTTRTAPGFSIGRTLSLVNSGERPAIIIFSDQLVSPDEATLLLRTNDGDLHVSPFELILNQRYGYSLKFWSRDGLSKVERHCSTQSTILHELVNYLGLCHKLGSQWLMRDDHLLRSPIMRTYNARKKTRALRSALISHYKVGIHDAELETLIDRTNTADNALIVRLENLSC